MHLTNLACPNCSKALKLTQALPPGTRVRCTGCGRPFALPPSPVVAAPPIHVEPPAPVPQGRGFVLGLLVGVVLMLAGAGVGLALYLNRDKDKQHASADPKSDRPKPPDETPKATDKGPDKGASRPEPTEKEPRDKKPADETAVRPGGYDPPPVKPPPDPVKPPGPMKEPDPVKPPAPKPFETTLSPEEQAKVNAAIEKGVRYLKSKQQADGAWPAGNAVLPNFPCALAALPGLTLLECGVPADDPVVRQAAENVRGRAARLSATYEVSVALLFLDRLGNPDDRPLIRSLALRLIAGQTISGGWRYPTGAGGTREQEADFLKALTLTRPRNHLELFVPGAGGRPAALLMGVRPELVPNAQFDPDVPFRGEEFGRLVATLPGHFRDAVVLRAPSKLPPNPVEYDVDNSNTQFATLALLAAGRHDVPVERSLALVARRFRSHQDALGGWSYRSVPGEGGGAGTPSMTCAGLLGLAVGHGLLAHPNAAVPGAKPLDDPGVRKGLRRVAECVGRPFAPSGSEGLGDANAVNLYFLWSLERVGVLFNLPKIEGKDWYAWGVHVLLDGQKAEGSWSFNNFGGTSETVDTCLSLLVLKRANLAKSLTVQINKLELLEEEKPRK